MKKLTLLTAPLAAFAMLSAPVSAEEKPAENAEKTEGEIKLAKMLEGRVAGKPTSCIRNFPGVDLTIIDDTALVYKSGSTLYVNIPRNPRSIDNDDTLVTRLTSNRLCRSDIVTTVDRFSGFYTGNIMLSDFVPYRKEG